MAWKDMITVNMRETIMEKITPADLAKNDLKRVDYVFHIWDLPSCQVQQTITNLKQEKHHNQL